MNEAGIQAMDEAEEAELVRLHERWLQEGRDELQQQLQDLSQGMSIYTQLLMLLTLERHLLETVQQAINNLPPGSPRTIVLSFMEMDDDRHCRTPPTDEAMLATATELAHILSSVDSFKHLCLIEAPSSFASLFLSACSQVESV